MRILNRYLVRDYLLTFALTVAVFSFVMCIGSIIRAIDYVSRGVSGMVILRYFLLSFPFLLQYTVPMSVMTTTLLLFTRLSMDGELTAMKACGLSLWQIIAPVILLSVIVSFFAIYLTNFLSPRSRYAQRITLSHFADEDPVALLEEGRFVSDFPDHMIRVGRKRGNEVTDLTIYTLTPSGQVKMNLRARSGTLIVDRQKKELRIEMRDVRMEQPDLDAPLDPSRMRSQTAAFYSKRVDLEALFKDQPVKKKLTDYTLLELTAAIRDVPSHFDKVKPEDRAKELMKLMIEANTRMATALSCFAFTLLGIPLGIRSRRRENSIGVLISLAIIFIFYAFIALTKPLAAHPAIRPDLLLWFPVLGAEILGLALIHRAR